MGLLSLKIAYCNSASENFTLIYSPFALPSFWSYNFRKVIFGNCPNCIIVLRAIFHPVDLNIAVIIWLFT